MWARCAFRVAGKFFECLDNPGLLARMARSRADVGEADLLQELADRTLVIDDPEALFDHPLEVDAPPPHDAVLGSIGTRLHDLGEGDQLVGCQSRHAAFRGNVLEPGGTVPIEPMNPVAQRLPIHPTDPRSLLSVHAINNRCQRQQAAALVGVPRGRRQAPKIQGRIVHPKLHRSKHGANSTRARESPQTNDGNPP